jgi:hypothetical protein
MTLPYTAQNKSLTIVPRRRAYCNKINDSMVHFQYSCASATHNCHCWGVPGFFERHSATEYNERFPVVFNQTKRSNRMTSIYDFNLWISLRSYITFEFEHHVINVRVSHYVTVVLTELANVLLFKLKFK